jgi:hypothetical protein
MFDLVIQFAVEVIRALLVDELSSRVRDKWIAGRKDHSTGRAVRRVHQRNRKRLLNKLVTEGEDEL